MNLAIKDTALTRFLKITLVIPLCVFLVLALCSRFLELNVGTLFLFWFIIVPFLILFLSSRLIRHAYAIRNAMFALISFYSIMVFMIYKHFQTDYFLVMMISFLWNLGIMIIVMISDRDERNSTQRQNTF